MNEERRTSNLAVLFPPAPQEQVRLIWDPHREVTRLAAITASDPALAKEMSRMIDAIGQGQRRILRALKRAPRVSD